MRGLLRRRALRDQALAPRRILVVKLSSFGDVVHVTPCLRALRRTHLGADIRVVVERRWADVLRASPDVDGLVEASSRTRVTPSYLLEIRDALAAMPGPFDLAIDFQGTRRSAAWVYMSGARVEYGRGWPRPLWRHALRPDLSRHAVEVCADVCRALAAPVDDLAPELHTSPADEQQVARLLARAGLPGDGFVVLNPFSRWDSKALDVATAAEVASRTATLAGDTVVVSGGPEDASRAAEVVRRAGSRAFSLAGELTLAEALCLLRRARLVISCDSGPMHAAAALGTPLVALFGPTHPERTGPWGDAHLVVQAERPPEHHAYRTDHARRYMRALGVDAIVAAVERALAATQAPSSDRRQGHVG